MNMVHQMSPGADGGKVAKEKAPKAEAKAADKPKKSEKKKKGE